MATSTTVSMSQLLIYWENRTESNAKSCASQQNRNDFNWSLQVVKRLSLVDNYSQIVFTYFHLSIGHKGWSWLRMKWSHPIERVGWKRSNLHRLRLSRSKEKKWFSEWNHLFFYYSLYKRFDLSFSTQSFNVSTFLFDSFVIGWRSLRQLFDPVFTSLNRLR